MIAENARQIGYHISREADPWLQKKEDAMEAHWMLYVYVSVPFGVLLLIAHILATRSLKKQEEAVERARKGQ